MHITLFQISKTTYDETYDIPYLIRGVPLANKPGISLIILPLMGILQRNLKWTYLIVYEM
jgi:hypothetical protein